MVQTVCADTIELEVIRGYTLSVGRDWNLIFSLKDRSARTARTCCVGKINRAAA